MKKKLTETSSDQVTQRAKVEALEFVASGLGITIPIHNFDKSLNEAATFVIEEALSWRVPSAEPSVGQKVSAAVAMFRLGPVVSLLLSYGHHEDRYQYRQLNSECVMGFDSVRPPFRICKGGKRVIQSEFKELLESREFTAFITRDRFTPWFSQAIPRAILRLNLGLISEATLPTIPISTWTRFQDLEIYSARFIEGAKPVYNIASFNGWITTFTDLRVLEACKSIKRIDLIHERDIILSDSILSKTESIVTEGDLNESSYQPLVEWAERRISKGLPYRWIISRFLDKVTDFLIKYSHLMTFEQLRIEDEAVLSILRSVREVRSISYQPKARFDINFLEALSSATANRLNCISIEINHAHDRDDHNFAISSESLNICKHVRSFSFRMCFSDQKKLLLIFLFSAS